MLDIKKLKQNLEYYQEQLLRKGYKFDIDEYKKLESARRDCQILTEELQSRRNKVSKAIGVAKKNKTSVDEMMHEMSSIASSLAENSNSLGEIQAKLDAWHLEMPNILHASVPDGLDESANCEVKQVGTIEKTKGSLHHYDVANIDLRAAVKIAGSRFSLLRGDLARLHRALGQFMLNLHVNEHGYEELYVPYLVNEQSLLGTGQLPKFSEDLFKLADTNYWLIPTAEVPVTNIVRDTILDSQQLPLKFACHTPCFRAESGTYGKDTRGIFRQHQFDKVELVQVVAPDESYSRLEELLQHAEKVLQLLELPYRVVTLCSGDTGFASAKTYDIEVWLPGQNTYREISSCSNFEAFQARRMQTRFKNKEQKTELVHTVNGSGVAVGRALIAVIENYCNESGDLTIPHVLRPYMNDIETIKLVV